MLADGTLSDTVITGVVSLIAAFVGTVLAFIASVSLYYLARVYFDIVVLLVCFVPIPVGVGTFLVTFRKLRAEISGRTLGR
jgi:predicted Co/Zn/Cd cation transporter (cation efflux family)